MQPKTRERPKVSKAAVRYRMAAGKRQCGNCAMYHARTHECDLVNGQIVPQAVCDKWVGR